jgi:hypothetical protein
VRTAVHPPAASLDDDPAGSRELIDRLDEMQPQEADFDVCVAQLAGLPSAEPQSRAPGAATPF